MARHPQLQLQLRSDVPDRAMLIAIPLFKRITAPAPLPLWPFSRYTFCFLGARHASAKPSSALGLLRAAASKNSNTDSVAANVVDGCDSCAADT